MIRLPLIALLALLPAFPIAAATLVVDSGSDAADMTPGDGICQADDGSGCTLRAALDETNAQVGPDTVIISAAVARVALELGTLAMTDANTLLYSESGTAAIDGLLNPSGAALLTIAGDSNQVHGVMFRRSRGDGVVITGKANQLGATGADSYTGFTNSGLDGAESGAIVIRGGGAVGNVVTRCLIGLAADGLTPAGNHNGIVIEAGASGNTVGSIDTAGWNVISGNDGCGIVLRTDAHDNTIVGAMIGLAVGGFEARPNARGGVWLGSGASNNMIGEDGSHALVFISGNDGDGVLLTDEGTTGNRIQSAVIGLDGTGLTSLGNAGAGVRITSQASKNIIGGRLDLSRNLIAGNALDGIRIEGSGTNDNVVGGNWIGIAGNGFRARSNGLVDGHGITIIDGARRTRIGGPVALERNVIAGQINHGVLVSGATTRDTKIVGNYIGLNPDGAFAFANGAGVVLRNGASYTTIGGTSEAERNLIGGAYNQNYPFGGGVVIYDEGTSFNTVIGNYIGVDSAGGRRTPNYSAGVIIGNGASNNRIGGRLPGEGNLISGNGFSPLLPGLARGVHIDGPTTTANVIQGNMIGTTAGGDAKLRNAGHGIALVNGANENVIGGTLAGECNLIAFNDHHGVFVAGAATAQNTIRGNVIRNNDSSGVVVVEDAQEGIAPPVILSAAESGYVEGQTATVSGLVDIYRAEPDIDGRGEPAEFLGTAPLSAGAFVVQVTGLAAGDTITAMVTDTAGNSSACASNVVVSTATAIGDDQPEVPLTFTLSPNFPNPFNPSTEISFSLPVRSHIDLRIYNALGQHVATLVEETRPAGEYSVRWDGRSSNGSMVASGIYFYRLHSELGTFSRKMLLLR